MLVLHSACQLQTWLYLVIVFTVQYIYMCKIHASSVENKLLSDSLTHFKQNFTTKFVFCFVFMMRNLLEKGKKKSYLNFRVPMDTIRSVSHNKRAEREIHVSIDFCQPWLRNKDLNFQMFP